MTALAMDDVPLRSAGKNKLDQSASHLLHLVGILLLADCLYGLD